MKEKDYCKGQDITLLRFCLLKLLLLFTFLASPESSC